LIKDRLNTALSKFGEDFELMRHPNDWLGVGSSYLDSHCGDTSAYFLSEALDGTDMWVHAVEEIHWFILDLGQSYTISKVRGRSLASYDPIDVDIYVSDDKQNWGIPVATGISSFQDTDLWQEEAVTKKRGRFVKVVINQTENPIAIWWGNLSPSFTIFDVYVENIELKGKAGMINRATNPWATQYLKQAIFSADEIINPGEIIRDKTQDIYYFVYTLQREYISTILTAQVINLLKADKFCEIQRLQGQAGPFGGTKQEFVTQAQDIRCHLREITADLRTERPALLERASFLLYMQNNEDLQILDRAIIDAQNYQVEHIDKTIVQGLFEAQLSLDKR
jgi:hypothetical protein